MASVLLEQSNGVNNFELTSLHKFTDSLRVHGRETLNATNWMDVEIGNISEIINTEKITDYSGFQIQNSLYSDCGLDTVLIQSFKHLLKMYSTSRHVTPDSVPDTSHEGGESEQLIVMGGLQQYLIKTMKKTNVIIEQPRRGFGSSSTTFHDLPDSAQLEIFSYLGAMDLCRISMVCRHWYCVASDNILWQKKLQNDVRHWNVISHTSNPDMYQECNSDWTYKEIYLRCSPDMNKLMKLSNSNFHNLSNILRTFLPKKTPRVAMFGPGLESSTSLIARKILEDKSGIFTITGMFPGQFEGMGSGFTMKMDAVIFHLMTLYTSTKQERESRAHNQRLQNSRLLAHNHQEGAACDQDAEGYEVRKAIKDLCQTVDAFIFVLDASQDLQTVCSSRSELHAMINDGWVSVGVPLVVMSCVSEPEQKHHSAIDVARTLKLSKLSRPWQVRDCVVDSLHGVTDAIYWVVTQAQRNK